LEKKKFLYPDAIPIYEQQLGDAKSMEDIPNEILICIFEYLDNFKTLYSCARVCKNWCSLITSKKIDSAWRASAFKRFPKMLEFNMAYGHITNWRVWLSKRLSLVTNSYDSAQEVFIENCYEWEFLCPIASNQLHHVDNTTDFCSHCNKSVYIVSTPSDLELKVLAGQCVTIDFDGRYQRNRDDATDVKRGGKRRPKGFLERLGF